VGPSSGAVCTALQQLTAAQRRREDPRCWAARTLLREPFTCSQASCPLTAACQALQWHQACSWPCMGTDNLGRSGESGHLKTPNGQIEGCSAAQWLNTPCSCLRQTGFPGLGHLCHRVRQNGCRGMLVFSEPPRSAWQHWHQSPRRRAERLTAPVGWME